MATLTYGIAATGVTKVLPPSTSVSLSTLFTTYNITLSANYFDAQITTNDGSYIIGPTGIVYGFNQLTPDIPLSQLGQTYFMSSSSTNAATLIAFNSDYDTATSSLYSFPAVSVILGNNVVQGFDYPYALSSAQANAAHDTGYGFAVRYYCSDGSESPLTAAETTTLENASLQIVTVFENKSEAGAYTNGTSDARSAKPKPLLPVSPVGQRYILLLTTRQQVSPQLRHTLVRYYRYSVTVV